MTTPTTVRAAITVAADNVWLIGWLVLCVAVALAVVLGGVI